MYARFILAAAVAVAGLVSTAQAKHTCHLTIKFENKTKRNVAGTYKMGIKLGSSKVKAKGGFYVPIASKKSIWSPKLKPGASATKSVKVTFREPCWRQRTFRFHTCFKKMGAPGKAICSTGISSRRAESGSWNVKYRIEQNPVNRKKITMRTSLSTDEKREAKSPLDRRCRLVFNVKNVSGEKFSNIGLNLSSAKVQTKGGVWVKMPQAKWSKPQKSTNFKVGETRTSIATVYFREPCKRKRLFKIQACYSGFRWSVPPKCTTIGGYVGGKKLKHRSGPYTFNVEAHGKRVKLTRFK